MTSFSIKDKCRISKSRQDDAFVGVVCTNGRISITFPLGFHISEDEKTLRRDILLLLDSIASTTGKRASRISEPSGRFSEAGFPLQAYLWLLADYFGRGLYRESEMQHRVSDRGKISWRRTIQTQDPYLLDDEAYYLNFVTRRPRAVDDEFITRIHEFCVYESFQKIGWLFACACPKKPVIKFDRRLFLFTVNDKLRKTNNDRNRQLFMNMLAVIRDLRDPDALDTFRYGTNQFEYVWEALIDRVFGVPGKERYYPKTVWHIRGRSSGNAALEPDTIMLCRGNVYVLDAKYYKYGDTQSMSDLPGSSSISKQITYGEYIAEQDRFKKIHGTGYKVFNAFLMPFDAENWHSPQPFLCMGEATADWKSCRKEYERIEGVLVDVKHLMAASSASMTDIDSLASCIEEAICRGGAG